MQAHWTERVSRLGVTEGMVRARCPCLCICSVSGGLCGMRLCRTEGEEAGRRTGPAERDTGHCKGALSRAMHMQCGWGCTARQGSQRRGNRLSRQSVTQGTARVRSSQAFIPRTVECSGRLRPKRRSTRPCKGQTVRERQHDEGALSSALHKQSRCLTSCSQVRQAAAS